MRRRTFIESVAALAVAALAPAPPLGAGLVSRFRSAWPVSSSDSSPCDFIWLEAEFDDEGNVFNERLVTRPADELIDYYPERGSRIMVAARYPDGSVLSSPMHLALNRVTRYEK